MTCPACGKIDAHISRVIGVCSNCLKQERIDLANIHAQSRVPFHLPPDIPDDQNGIICNRCANNCRIADDKRGFCGVRYNRGNRLRGGNFRDGWAHWYLDALPTNCVADWVCPAGSTTGYPDFSHSRGAEFGFYNLAVFYYGCTFDCLFCQNWQWRTVAQKVPASSARDLAAAVTDKVSCICFFGGDPTPHLPHALAAAKRARRQSTSRILRICWETNGAMNPELLDRTNLSESSSA